MKKFLCMMMAVLMVLAMAACGGEPANNGGNDTPDATTVKIGGIGPLTGAYANYGLSEKNGAELAVKEINEAGGIAGKQIELSYQDSQGESESAVNAYGKLMDWGMEVSLGCVLSGENASVVAAARDDDVLLITPSGSTSGAALASALTSLTVEGVTGTMTWGSDGNTNKPASAILYYDGVGTLFDSQD